MTKAREEDKIRALRDAGFDMDLGGADITSRPIPERQQLRPRQRRVHARGRGRHRVRAARPQDRRGHRDRRRPRAVPQDQPRPRGSAPTRVSNTTTPSTTGTPTPRPAGSPRPTRARNTCRSTTPRATWPRSTCSSSSRTTTPSTPSGSPQAVELIITAMDISICFADFPTEAIGDTTRDYRQLGIGYANLGALLMAMGLGYDSDGGRAMAAAITSLMTGTSYRRSAELAARRRPLRRLRPQRRGAPAGDAQAPGRQRHRPHASRSRTPRCTSWPPSEWAEVVDLGETERLPQRPGLGARPDRDHRLHDGLRHHRHRARLLAGQVQEAGRRRLDADRQPDHPARAAQDGLPARAGRGDRRLHRRARPRHRRPRPQARALRGLRHRDGRPLPQADGPRPDDGGLPSRSSPAPSPRRSTCPSPPRSRRSRTSTCSRGSSASRPPRSTATTARSASRSPTASPSPPRRTRRMATASAEVTRPRSSRRSSTPRPASGSPSPAPRAPRPSRSAAPRAT